MMKYVKSVFMRSEENMRIYIDIQEYKDKNDKVIAAYPCVSIEVEIDEGYDTDKLSVLKHDLQTMLDNKIKECIQ